MVSSPFKIQLYIILSAGQVGLCEGLRVPGYGSAAPSPSSVWITRKQETGRARPFSDLQVPVCRPSTPEPQRVSTADGRDQPGAYTLWPPDGPSLRLN